jgi:uncharacterized protein (DUF433 family)
MCVHYGMDSWYIEGNTAIRLKGFAMQELSRITRDPAVMNGKPCIRGMRVTIDLIVGMLAAGQNDEEILAAYPYLEPDDIREATTYALRSMEHDKATPKRQYKSAKGKVHMLPDFDEPLEDFAEYI